MDKQMATAVGPYSNLSFLTNWLCYLDQGSPPILSLFPRP